LQAPGVRYALMHFCMQDSAETAPALFAGVTHSQMELVVQLPALIAALQFCLQMLVVASHVQRVSLWQELLESCAYWHSWMQVPAADHWHMAFWLQEV